MCYLRRSHLTMGCSIAVLWFGAAAASAQTLGSGTIAGRVTDEAGQPVVGARVSLFVSEDTAVAAASTARDGGYAIHHAEPGRYSLLVEALGYRPVEFRAVILERGSWAWLPVTLRAASVPPSGRVVRGAVVPPPPGSLPLHSLASLELRVLPFRSREGRELTEAFAGSGEASVEGLPLRFLGQRISGTAGGPPPDGALSLHEALPLGMLGGASLRSLADVEWDAPAGTALDLGVPTHANGTGWSLGAVAGAHAPPWQAAPGEGGDLFVSSTWGGSVADAATARTGAAWHRRSLLQRPSAALEGVGQAVREVAANHGRTAPPPGEWLEAESWGIIGGAGVSWSEKRHLRAHTVLTRSTLSRGFRGSVTGDREPVSVLSTLLRLEYLAPAGAAGLSESRIGIRFGAADPVQDDLPLTVVADGPFFLGARQQVRRSQTSIWGSQTFHRVSGSHLLKGGVSAELLLPEISVAPVSEPVFLFGDPESMAAARGFATHPQGAPSAADLALPRYALFLQDSWRVSPRLQVLGGARLVVDQLPRSDIALEERWYFPTGVPNNDIPALTVALEPRFGIDWAPGAAGAWRLFAAGGLYHARIDAGALAELVANDGSLGVRRSHGDLGDWPESHAVLLPERSGLTVPGPTFRPPRTLRLQGGVVRRIGRSVSAALDLVARRTDRLLTRRDGNRRSTPRGTLPDGRALWGTLVKVDGALSGTPAGWAFTPDFDHVWVLDTSASSRYLGLTGQLRLGDGDTALLDLGYTFSATRDDWLSPASHDPGTQVAPDLLLTGRPQWSDGIGDLDVPHRATARGVVPLPLPGGPTLAARYSIRSGLPFTPGFGPAIDYNGDGLANDPAFIDPAMPGMAELLQEWPCLREGAGTVAERNGCRGAPVQRLDASLRFDLPVKGSGRLSLTIEALGLLATRTGVRNEALYRVDRSAPLEQTGADVVVPLLVNPRFGELLVETSPRSVVRFGVEAVF